MPVEEPPALTEAKPDLAEVATTSDNGKAVQEAPSKKRRPFFHKPLPAILTEYHHQFYPRDFRFRALQTAGHTAIEGPEAEVEIAIIMKMKEYRRMLSQDGPYADIDLEGLLNPADRVEAILATKSSRKRHALNNMFLQQLAESSMRIIEAEQDSLKVLHRLSSILQGDDLDWQDVDFGGTDLEPVRNLIQDYLYNRVLFVEKMQLIRDRISSIQARKKEFLHSLKNRFSQAAE